MGVVMAGFSACVTHDVTPGAIGGLTDLLVSASAGGVFLNISLAACFDGMLALFDLTLVACDSGTNSASCGMVDCLLSLFMGMISFEGVLSCDSVGVLLR